VVLSTAWGAIRSYGFDSKSLSQRIADHQIKIALERQRTMPNLSLIRHWETEIRAWEHTAESLKRRLKRGKRHD
jgi:hypothetical protein